MGHTAPLLLQPGSSPSSPPGPQVLSAQRVQKKFNARHFCQDRSYEYLLPAHLLGLTGQGGEQEEERVR